MKRRKRRKLRMKRGKNDKKNERRFLLPWVPYPGLQLSKKTLASPEAR